MLAGLETASAGLIEVELPSGVKLRISGDVGEGFLALATVRR